MGMVLWLCTARTGRNLVASLIRAAQWSETDHPLPPRRHEAVAAPRGLTAALGGLGLGSWLFLKNLKTINRGVGYVRRTKDTSMSERVPVMEQRAEKPSAAPVALECGSHS